MKNKALLIAGLLISMLLTWIPSVALHELTHLWQGGGKDFSEICFFGWSNIAGPAWIRGGASGEIIPMLIFYGGWMALSCIGFWMVIRIYESSSHD